MFTLQGAIYNENKMTETSWPYAAKVRLYVPHPLAADETLSLDGSQHHYLTHVMRHKQGDAVLLFNGRDGEWLAQIANVAKKQCSLTVLERTRAQDGVPDVWLLFAPVKRLRQDFLVQKATELGVAVIQPVQTQRTEVTRVKEDRLIANVIEAAEQSGRLTIPEIQPFVKLSDLLYDWDAHRKLVFCDEAGDALPMADALSRQKPDQPWAILIGPEGGFDPTERDMLRKSPFVVPVTLGPRAMRADTAAIAALTLWQSVLGDLR